MDVFVPSGWTRTVLNGRTVYTSPNPYPVKIHSRSDLSVHHRKGRFLEVSEENLVFGIKRKQKERKFVSSKVALSDTLPISVNQPSAAVQNLSVYGGALATAVQGGALATAVRDGALATAGQGGALATAVQGGALVTAVHGGALATAVQGGALATAGHGGALGTAGHGGALGTAQQQVGEGTMMDHENDTLVGHEDPLEQVGECFVQVECVEYLEYSWKL